jgi:hypothetical protein
MKATYDVSDVFREGKTQNCQHALEGVVMVIDAVHVLQPTVQHGRVSHIRDKQVGSV